MHNLQNYKRENVINAKSLLPKLNLVQEAIIMDKPRHKFVITLYPFMAIFRHITNKMKIIMHNRDLTENNITKSYII